MTALGEEYLNDVRILFTRYRDQAERAIDQVDDDAFFRVIEADGNSIAIIVKHMAGNMRSRWTDFLTSDGEKPDRRRDTEFVVEDSASRIQLMESWDRGWTLLFRALDDVTPDTLLDTITIRNEPHSVMQAINRQLTHYASHVGQIITLARQAQGEEWQSLSIPRGQSESFNVKMMKS